MITYNFDLDMVPGGHRTEVWLNQYDEDFELKINLFARDGTFTVQSGTTAAIRGTKPDGNGFSANATIDGTVVTISGDKQITAAAGKAVFELTLYRSGKELNTANFTIHIERAALDKDTPASDSKLREFTDVWDRADEIINAGQQYADSQAAMEKLAKQTAEDAEAAHSAREGAEAALATINKTFDEDIAALQKASDDALKAVNDKAAAIAQLTTDADTIAKQALEKASNAENETAEFSNLVDSLQKKLRQLELEGASYAQELEVDGNGLVYLLNNGERIAGPYGPFAGSGGGSGGGTSGNNAELTVSNITGWLSTTIADGDGCPVKILWSSVEDNIPTGDGTAKITVNGIVKAMLNIQQGEVTIDLAPYITTGTNVVKVNISDVYDNNRTINFSITSITLGLSSSFDASTPYQGAISFPYTPVGSVNKTLHFLLDGKQIGTTTTSVSGRQMSFTIPQQSHGAHTFEAYFDCDINGQSVESNHLYYEIICLEALNTEPIIVSSFNQKEAAQYTTLHVDYTVYDPLRMTADVIITVNGAQAAKLTVDRTQQVFTYRADTTGKLSIVITSGAISKTLTVNITESDIHVEAETDQLKLYLASAGRSNNEENPGTWKYEDIEATFSNFNFRSDGWQRDNNGITVLRVAGDARVEIPYKAFATDFRGTGKTIELEFATRDVMNYDATIMSCMSGGRGFSLTAQLAKMASEQSEISMQYKEEEHVRIAFVVEKRSEHRLMYIYVNGIMSGAVQYPANDDFSQPSPVGISIGSNDCTIDLYCIRVYDNNLERGQVLTNWIADTQMVDDMLARYQRNSVYDEYGNIVISRLPSDLPYLIIECPELPQYKGDKKTVSVTYVDPVANSRNFTATGAEADVQGTSSQYYARKNYKIKFKKGFLMQNGTQADKYPLRPGAIPTNAFTFKADVASSEGANNVELVRLYNDANPYKTPAQAENEAVRQGIDGFPIVVFWSNGSETTFLGKYNFNNDKGTEEVYGFVEGDESWEILNNTSNRVLWKSADYSGDGWLNDFEGRYPDGNTDPTHLKELAEWLASTDQSAVTSESDKAARLKKFKDEFTQHFEKDAVIFYYLFTELFLMVDSRAKNAFPTFMGGSKWFSLPYDFDTAIGINNEGSLVFSYNLEDIDHTESGEDIFNGQQSVLWINLRQAFYDDIAAMYKTLRSTGALSYDKVVTMFEEHQAKWGEAIFNEDAYFKYLQPLIDDGSGAYLAMLQGSKAEQRKWWLYNRFRYMDSKYNAGDALSDVIQLRGYAKADITVTPYADIYAAIKYGSYLVQTRAKRNEQYTLDCPLDNVNDTEILVHSASQLASVGDLSGLMVGYADFSMGTKLQSIKLGDSASGYRNGNMKELYLGNNVLLRVLDVRNCPNLGQGDMKSVDISGCKNIEEVYFDGTSVTGVDLPDGGILRKLHLPATVTNLTIRNQTALTELQIPSYANISTLWLDNVSAAVDTKAILRAIPASSRVRLTNFRWEAENAAEIEELFDILDTMRGLDEYGGNMDKAQVYGTIHTAALTGAEIAAFNARYQYVDVVADHTTSYIYYYTYDGSQLLYTEPVYDGGDGGSYAGKPTRTSTAQYEYTFAGWSKSMNATKPDADALTKITADRTVYAAYTATVRTYRVRFYNGSTLLQTVDNVPYGGSATYTGDTPTNVKGDPFLGWDPKPTNITGNTDCYAQFEPTYSVYFYNGSTLLQTVTGIKKGGTATYTGDTPVKTGVSDPENYEFTGWSPPNTNIQGDTSCYAQFKSHAVPSAKTADGAYGVEWDYSNSSPVLTRKGLAANFDNPTPATSVSGSGSSPFDSIMPWAGMKRYNVIDGAISYSEDDPGFSQTDYDTVVYIPPFYYTAYKDTESKKWLWAISPTEKEGYVQHPGSGRYVGRYHTSGSASAVFSKSGVAPLVNTSQTNFRTYSHNKGAKWYMLDLASWSAIQMLYLVEYANFNSQQTLGEGYAGVTSAVAAGGDTDNAAYHTLQITKGHNQYRWIEDPFSNCYDWIDGYVGSTSRTYAAASDTGYAGGTTGLNELGFKLPASGAIQGFGYSEEAPWAFIPDTASGTDYTTFVCDRVASNSSTYPACVGGSYNTNALYGLFYFYGYNSATYTYANLGSRLLYIP